MQPSAHQDAAHGERGLLEPRIERHALPALVAAAAQHELARLERVARGGARRAAGALELGEARQEPVLAGGEQLVQPLRARRICALQLLVERAEGPRPVEAAQIGRHRG